ncbi:MAG: hypothetical protein A3H67_03360 [Candidatus Buchananbacteria bacterium RIFCSPLOWO2_02_FULL_46_11b]|uniref:Glycosyltransferase RgtA/B/C/D-like domain-containing protein n=2 Tax=Candidatus Buchananiibacteriota TaxID=1817903 RepID=A0A1G1YMA0_9BACT|nr:MAG: hypothetical protein A3B15_01435 [Candidatus Buchananbacteria bacterium RIFCSPLOWO2_01_FULL_45_31]OGY57824.1 MAG: hypothetical protein A3H67_03360 [Candidatus Buchananbacteria bacterium RIFCSPLOWO2_02_FULL_46_11b]
MAGLIILAAAVRLAVIFNFGTYTFDDLFSVHFARMNLPEMFSYLKNEVHPLFYYFLLHFWLAIFGGKEITARLLSLILNLACLPLLYYLTKQLINKQVAFLAGLIFALSCFQIFNSAQVRMYGLLTFLGLLSLNLFWLYFVRQKKYTLLLCAIANVLMLLTHLGGIFGVIIQILWFLILIWKKQISRPMIIKFALAQIVILTAWLFWLIPIFLPKLTDIIQQGWYLQSQMNRNPALGVYDYFFPLLRNYWLRLVSGTIIFCAPFLILIWPRKDAGKNIPGNISPNWFLLAWFLPGFLISVLTGLNLPRIFSVSYLGFYVAAAYLLYIIFKSSKKTFWLILIFWLTAATVNLNIFISNNFSRWDLICRYLTQNQKNGGKIILSHFPDRLQYQYYCQTPVIAFYPFEDNQNFDERIVKNNWRITTPESLEKFGQEAAAAEKIFIVYEGLSGGAAFDALSRDWLLKNGWQKTGAFRPSAIFGPEVIVYEKK